MQRKLDIGRQMIFGKNELGRPVITFIKTKLLQQLTPYMKK